jgi:hypothetical protein
MTFSQETTPCAAPPITQLKFAHLHDMHDNSTRQLRWSGGATLNTEKEPATDQVPEGSAWIYHAYMHMIDCLDCQGLESHSHSIEGTRAPFSVSLP